MQAPAYILATARPAASYMETLRSQYSTPYFSRILKPSPSHEPGIRKMAMACRPGPCAALEARP